jgi:hypothetical protein
MIIGKKLPKNRVFVPSIALMVGSDMYLVINVPKLVRWLFVTDFPSFPTTCDLERSLVPAEDAVSIHKVGTFPNEGIAPVSPLFA